MLPIMTTSAEVLVQELDRRTRQQTEVDVYSVFQSLTLDVIGRCAFGLQTQAQTDRHDQFLNNIRSLFNTMSTTLILPLVSKYTLCFSRLVDQRQTYFVCIDHYL